MRVVIVGCGRVGATLANKMDGEGHEVTIVDTDPGAFRRLSPEFRGTAIVGLGIDEDVLRNAGIEGADAFAGVTDDDSANVMACQVAKLIFNVRNVIARAHDPLWEETYRSLDIKSISPTAIGADLIRQALSEHQ